MWYGANSMKTRIFIGIVVLAAGVGAGWMIHSRQLAANGTQHTAPLNDAAAQNAGQEVSKPLLAELKSLLEAFRKTIVLFADEAKLTPAERDAANTVGQMLFHDALGRRAQLSTRLNTLATTGRAANLAARRGGQPGADHFSL